jgi:hypothetical protein
MACVEAVARAWRPPCFTAIFRYSFCKHYRDTRWLNSGIAAQKHALSDAFITCIKLRSASDQSFTARKKLNVINSGVSYTAVTLLT